MITKYDVKNFFGSLVGFGKENAPAIMTGGSIILGWTAVYIFWKQGKKAQHTIDVREAEMNSVVADGENVLGRLKRPEEQLPKSEKVSIYLSYCWLALALGLLSTGFAVWGQKISLDKLGMAYMTTQFFKDKNDKLEKNVKAQEGGEKQYEEMKRKQHREEYPPEEIYAKLDSIPGEGRTVFIDTNTGASWKWDMKPMIDAIADSNATMKREYDAAVEEKRRSKRKTFGNGPFDVRGEEPYTSDSSPYFDDSDYENIHSTLPLDKFLFKIGEIKHPKLIRCGEILCFNYYGGYKDGQLLRPKDILDCENYMDPTTGVPALCYVDYVDYLSPTYELLERNPL